MGEKSYLSEVEGGGVRGKPRLECSGGEGYEHW